MSDAHLLPPSATHAEVAVSRAMSRLADVEPQCRQMWDPATCPPSHLPWLAWAFSVDEWDSGWTDTQRARLDRSARRAWWWCRDALRRLTQRPRISRSDAERAARDAIERAARKKKNLH